MKKTFQPRSLFVALILSCASSVAQAEGHLLAVGGMLRASNVPVYAKFVELAGGRSARRRMYQANQALP